MRHLSACLYFEREPRLEDLTLNELEEKVFEVTRKQNFISNCEELSSTVVSAAVAELEVQKEIYKSVMRKKIDNL